MDQRSGSLGRVGAIQATDDDLEENEVEVTRAQIEQTRSGMSDTIEAIKDKLNPQVLMNQAKETVTDVAGTLAQRAKDTVHDVTSDVLQQAKTSLPDMTSNLAQQAKETVHEVTSDVLQQAKTNLPEIAHQAVHGAVSEAKEAVGNAVHSAGEAVGDAVDTARDAGSSVVRMIERNPLPTALIATGLGWYWMKVRHDEAERQRSRETRYWANDSTRSNMAPQSEFQRGSEAAQRPNGQPSPIDSARQAVGSAVDTAREAVGNAAHSAQAAVGGAMDTARGAGSSVVEVMERNPLPTALLVTSLGWLWMNHRGQADTERSAGRRDTNDHLRRYDDPWRQYEAPSPSGAVAAGASAVTEALRGAQDRVGEVAGQMQDKAGQLVDQVQDKAGQLVDQVQDKAGRIMDRTQDRVSQLGSSAAQQIGQSADMLQRTMRQNPMAVGAVALGMGAALGLLIPETRQENEWLGEARDRVLHKAQETVQEVGLKAQIVAEEAIGAAKQEAKAQGLAPDQERTP